MDIKDSSIMQQCCDGELHDLIRSKEFASFQEKVKNVPSGSVSRCLLTVNSGRNILHELINNHPQNEKETIESLQLCLSRLLELGEDQFTCLTSRDDMKSNLLHLAGWQNCPEAAKLLLSNLPKKSRATMITDLNSRNNPSLYYAGRHPDGRVFRVLCDELLDEQQVWVEIMRHECYDLGRWQTDTILQRLVQRDSKALEYVVQRARLTGTLLELIKNKNSRGDSVLEIDMTKRANTILSKNLPFYVLPKRYHQKTHMFALIFCNSFSASSMENLTHARPNAEEEARDMEAAWAALGFQTRRVMEWTSSDLLEIMQGELEGRQQTCVMLVLVIMTHGTEGAVYGRFAEMQEDKIALSEIVRNLFLSVDISKVSNAQ